MFLGTRRAPASRADGRGWPDAPTADRALSPLRRVQQWSLWTNRAAVLSYVLAVDVAAVVLGIALGVGEPVTTHGLVTLALLVAGMAVHSEVARHVERLREVNADGRVYVDLKGMWSFAGLLLLPIGPALLLVVITHGYYWFRVSRRPVVHRWVFSAATIVIATGAAHLILRLAPTGGILDGSSGSWALVLVVLAAVVRSAVNLGMVVVVISLSSPTVPWLRRLGSPIDHVIDLGALALGVVLAALATTSPWLIPLLLVPLMTMHRSARLRQLVRAVQTDEKTGLSTGAHWHAEATRTLARAVRRRSSTSVLMVDVDRFKDVNDTHGHLVGDEVLRAVADTLVRAVREDDAVGRFGGEEFVVLLEDTDHESARETAERLRRHVGALAIQAPSVRGPIVVANLSVSVGVATSSTRAQTLDDLILAADAALFTAKRAGRDRVESAVPTS